MRLTESNLKEQLRSTDIVVSPEVTISETYNHDRIYIRIDARSIDSRAGYVDIELDEYCLITGIYDYDYCIHPYHLYFDPNEMHYYRVSNTPHLDTTFIPEIAEAKELVRLGKKHTLIFDSCLVTTELTYDPKYGIYVVNLKEKIPGILKALTMATCCILCLNNEDEKITPEELEYNESTII